ncbi:MAG: N-acetylmuramoyl-L-alanine amidase, partial [Ensifer adhaerens]
MTSKYCDYPGARFMPSPNFGDRADRRAPDMIVLHYT